MTGGPAGPRRRNAAETRRLLLEAARLRFAHDGYGATTVRDIADDAGVNVALINRYFESKEGLFSACLTAAVEALRSSAGAETLEEITEVIAGRAESSTVQGRPNPDLLLLLRSSGDERTEEMRLGILRGFAERLAAFAGWRDGEPDVGDLLLRAQIVLAAAIGIELLRSTAGIEPLVSATAKDLTAPLHDLIGALLAGT